MDRTTSLLRLGIVAAALAAALGPRLPGAGEPPGHVLVFDLSASLGRSGAGGVPATEEWLAVADGQHWVPAGAVPVGLARAATTLGAALAEAAASRPGRDVLLVSDGRATDDALAGARAVLAARGRVFTRPPTHPSADVGLLAARLERLGPGGPARATLTLASSTAGRASLSLSRSGRICAAQEVDLEPGTRQTVTLLDPEPPTEAASYLARVEALPGTPDDDPANDALALGLAPVKASVRVWGDLDLEALRRPGEGPEVSRLVEPGEGELAAADLVVLAGLPWSAIGPGRAEALARFTAAGGRMLLLGGPTGYAPGGWGGTPLETSLSPLRVRGGPDGGATIVIALDVSGSTGGEPLLALTRAAREALAGLQPGERLAVLPFRGTAQARPLDPGFVAAGDAVGRAELERALGAVVAGGPTDLASGIAAAIALLELASPAAGTRGSERRLLLLTDGDPDESPDLAALRALVAPLGAAQVRFAALVVGMPVAAQALRATLAARPEDVQLLEGAEGLASRLLGQLARQRARAEETRLGRPAALEGAPGSWAALLPSETALSWIHDVEPVEGALLIGRARLAGPGGATTAFAAERGHGAGRVHALAWGPGAEPDPVAAARLLAPLVARLAAEADRGVSGQLDAQGRLRVSLAGEAGRGRVTLVVGLHTLDLLEIAPALFESETPLPDGEDARVRGPGIERVVRLPARPAAEHRGVGTDLERLRALAQAGGGRLLPAGEDPPQSGHAPGVALAPVLLLLAGILLLVERRRAWSVLPQGPEDRCRP